MIYHVIEKDDPEEDGVGMVKVDCRHCDGTGHFVYSDGITRHVFRSGKCGFCQGRGYMLLGKKPLSVTSA